VITVAINVWTVHMSSNVHLSSTVHLSRGSLQCRSSCQRLAQRPATLRRS